MDEIILKFLSHNKISYLKHNQKQIKQNINSKICITTTNNYCKLYDNMIIKIGKTYYTIRKQDSKHIIKNHTTNKSSIIPKLHLKKGLSTLSSYNIEYWLEVVGFVTDESSEVV